MIAALFGSVGGGFAGSETLTINDLVERNGIYYKKFSNSKFNGKLQNECPKVLHEDIFQKGFKGNIKQGVRDGYWVITGCLGKSISKGNYSNGKRTGAWEFYNSDGQLSKVGFFKDDVSEGDWTWYDKWGRLIIKDRYQNGELVFWKGYDENEQLSSMGPYKNGEKVGIWEYFEKGKLVRTENWE